MNDLKENFLNEPGACSRCGGNMKFVGLGEYKCEDCGFIAQDDYGKVRGYLEEHRGATAFEVEQGTGVKQRTIRQLIREERVEVRPDSKVFLKCDMCGVDIRFGRYCAKCATIIEKQKEADAKKKINKNMSGYGKAGEQQSGEKRFKRTR